MPRSSLCLALAVSAAVAACGHAPPPPRAPRAAPPAKAAAPPGYGPASVDAALRSAWAREGVRPAPRADDATFLRRAYVDIVGTIPPVEVARAFLADTSADKRDKLVERLLSSPEYATHWTFYWDDVLMGRVVPGDVVDRAAFRGWLHARFAENAPWDRVVRELVSATGLSGFGGARARGPGLVEPMDAPQEGVNGAVNWALRFEKQPQDLAGSASRVFLGVQIQCAQCHDHKSEKWKTDDFRRLSSAFLHARVERVDDKEKGMLRRVKVADAPRVPPRFAKNPELAPIAQAKPTALDGTDLDKGAETRRALAAWMTSRENPWFAKAIVNRMWGHFLGRGFYDPVDDIRPSNPPTTPELLDALAADFVAHGFDLKHLVRTIARTEAYQLSASSEAKTDPENKLWARFHLVPLGPEELLNALYRATDIEATAESLGLKNVDDLRAKVVRQYAFLFDTDEEADEPDYSGTVSQALALLNGALVGQGTRALPGSALEKLALGPGSDADKIEALTLRVLSRPPTTAERDAWTAYVASAASEPKGEGRRVPVPSVGARGPLERLRNKGRNTSPRAAAYEDLFWALVNSSEFAFNH